MRRRTGSRVIHSVAMAVAIVCLIAACGKREEAKPAPPAQAPAAPAPMTQAAPTPPVAPVAPPAAAPAPTPAATPAPPPIGTIDSLEGEVRIVRAGVERNAQAKMALEPGDTLKAAAQSWALLAMVDGATVTVRPDTEMRLDAYRYAADGPPAENTASWSLVKGALRSITGLIGKTNPPGYQVKTPTATIGIRGTDHEPAYYPPLAPGEKSDHPPGTYDKVNSGESVIRSPRGTVPVRRGQTAFAHVEAKAKPQILARPPAFYQRQAEVDRRVAVRREQFHRDYEKERQERLQVLRVQQLEAAKKAQEERRVKQLEAQKQRLDAQKQQQDARKAEQDKRKAEQQQKKDQAKSAPRTDAKGKSDQKKADEKKAREKQQAEKAAPVPPAVADRIRNMQRGDKASPADARRDKAEAAQSRPQPQSQRAQPQREQPQRAQPQREQPQRTQPQREQPQQRQEPQRREQAQPERRQQQRPERDRKSDAPERR